MHYLIKFSKESNIKFISHLDLQKTLQRNFKRSGLPVEYSKGFNPHIVMSLAQPLAVGTYSTGDYLDIIFNEEVEESEILDKLNQTAPSGLRFFRAVKVREEKNVKKFKAMAAVHAAEYVIKIKYSAGNKLKDEMEALLEKENWEIEKVGKKNTKIVNIKPMIKKFIYTIEENILVIKALVSCGSIENLSPELLAKYIKENTNNFIENSFVEIERKEMYGKVENKLLPLCEYASTI